ncbi:MAG: hypothetical protein WCF36_18380 [Candidatus Nanopelagicales bacterium]
MSAGDHVKTADCRLLIDTNGDGAIDSEDSCIPVGGFINAMRPVNLAESLLDQAKWADPLALQDIADEPLTSQGSITSLRFQRDDLDAQAVPSVAFPSGTAKVCGLFDFDGMAYGTPVTFAWSLGGVADEARGNADYRWELGESGSGRACTGEVGTALPEGLWELSISSPDAPEVTGWVHVGDEYPLVGLTIMNELDQQICEPQVSPSVATTSGQDRMEPDALLGLGESVTIDVGADQYDVLAVTCDGARGARSDIDVSAPTAVTLNPSDFAPSG